MSSVRWVLECTTPGQDSITVKLPPGEYLLGREPTCHVILQGKQVSRRHARLLVGNGNTVTLEDMGSFNGTLVEGGRIQKAVLRGGEKVAVGEWMLALRSAAHTDSRVPIANVPLVTPTASDSFNDPTTMAVRSSLVSATVEKETAETQKKAKKGAALMAQATSVASERGRSALTPHHTPVASISMIMPALQVQWASSEKTGEPLRERAVTDSPLLRKITQHSTPLQVQGLPTDLSDLASLAQQNNDPQELALRLVYKVAAELQVARGEDDFLGAMADTILQSVRAQTVALLMCPAGADDPTSVVPRVVRSTGKIDATRFSKSVIEQVLRKKVAITTEDAKADQRFARNASVLDLDLKAVLAVPMMRDGVPVGVIYITRKIPFYDWEEDLVAAVGHLTAVGIERALLKERVAEEEALRRTLERFHTREVVEKLMQKQQQEHGGGLFLEPITATVLFCDLCGFTSYCDKHSTEEVGELLNGYLGEMTRVVYEFRGTVDKYIGDAVMAVFGAPFPAEDDAVRAAQCALAMQEAFGALMQTRPEKERLKLRVGVNTGPVVAGTVGSPLRLEYTCLGDTVNVAQRLESVAPPGGILLGKVTAQAVKDLLNVKSKGPVVLKGKAEGVEVFELLG